jgi:hypothetical protein
VGASIKVSDLRLPQMPPPPGEVVVVYAHWNSWMAIAFRARGLRPPTHGGQSMPGLHDFYDSTSRCELGHLCQELLSKPV